MGNARATAVIAAAGSGERLGAGGPKALVPIAGRPMLEWSLLAAAEARSVGAIVVAAPAGAEAACERAARAAGLAAGEVVVVPGGASRAESVRAALREVSGELVLVHDAARPLAGAELFDAICTRLAAREDADAVIAATPIADTVKRGRQSAGEGPDEVEATLERDHLWAAQTPQGFRLGPLLAAQREAKRAGTLGDATDEARLLELAGGRVLLEPAPGSNLKVTRPEDLAVAEALLAAAGRV